MNSPVLLGTIVHVAGHQGEFEVYCVCYDEQNGSGRYRYGVHNYAGTLPEWFTEDQLAFK